MPKFANKNEHACERYTYVWLPPTISLNVMVCACRMKTKIHNTVSAIFQCTVHHTQHTAKKWEGDGRERLTFSTIDELKQTSQCRKEEKNNVAECSIHVWTTTCTWTHMQRDKNSIEQCYGIQYTVHNAADSKFYMKNHFIHEVCQQSFWPLMMTIILQWVSLVYA